MADSSEDWREVPVFGARPEVEACVLRPSAYALVADDSARLAVVRTPQGVYLPGGGIETGKTPARTITREAFEECGLVIRPGVWRTRAVQFVYSESERTHFEKRSIFIAAALVGSAATRTEADHELVWLTPETAARTLSHQSQRWAVEQWQNRITHG
jgi:8-oxo-dGTP diphosphatase